MENLVIIGFGGHAKSIADSIRQAGQYQIIGYTDVNEKNAIYPYLGTDDRLKNIYEAGVRCAAVGLGYMGESVIRDELVQKAKNIGFTFPKIIDVTSSIAIDATIQEGCFVGKNAVINAEAKIGAFCIINSGTIVEHENRIGDYTHLAVGVKLCGNVKIGNHSFIGAGSIVIQDKKIGDNCMIGAGSLVLGNVGNSKKCYGVIQGV